ncbi:uncharacterized protein DNG_08228 [Cephalotrichum gorgonifer]|uniref:BTB domain-containing protein n=1 Tax=Cephalotrichum gorgonifer TaxID=2041049 RepID=A0AAE8N337_9PEZI|nr:uncharacterized protein DNG_08228 [Cephalotrichum gorgonifer]
MAPANGGANPRKGSASKPRPKNVVPAIPLTYMPRRAQNRVSTTQPPPSQANGDTQATPKGVAAELAKAEPVPAPTVNGTAKVEGEVQVQVQAQAAASEDSSAQVAVEPSFQAPSVPSTNSTVDDSGLDSTATGTPALDSPKSAPGTDKMNPPTGGPKAYAPPPSNPLPRSMPPPFHPSGNGPNMMYGGDMSLGPRPPHHQPHPSNSSLHFGAFHDSNSSSPAPHSGGYAPPPGLPLPNGRPSHMGRPSGPDFRPQSMMFGNDFEPTSVDPYGQSMASYAPHDGGYPPYMGNYLPSTPHSFHDSQSSGHPDDIYSQFSPHGATNGSQSHNQHQVNGGRPHPSGPMMGMHHPPPGMMPPMPPPHVVHRILEPDPEQFFSHFKNNFQDPRFADCNLELRFPDNRAPPLRIPAHRLVLSRSTFLEQLMVGDHNPRRKGSNASTVTITADDKYLRPDAFITALQRLYAFPLFSIPTPPPGSEDLPLAGGAVDRFNFVVSYAAAGHLLQCVSVVLRGMEMATQLLCWDTLEPALEFAVGASQARGTIDIHERYPYGDPTRILLEGIVGFVASRITTDFVLDPSVTDPQGYSRLPNIPDCAKRSASSKRPPAIARGSSVHISPGHQGRRSRLTNIKFGDMSVEGSAGVDVPNGPGPANPTQNHTSPQIAALSRVLLNLPFGCLKAVFESPRFGLDAESPEANSEARQRVAAEVISERESRRLAAVEAVTTGRVSSPDGARRVLSSVEPRAGDDWGVLGFQESVVPISNAHSPHISRAWIPLAGVDDDRGSSGTGWSGPAYP